MLYPSLGTAKPPKANSKAVAFPKLPWVRWLQGEQSDLNCHFRSHETDFTSCLGPAGICRRLYPEHIRENLGFKAMLALGRRDPLEDAEMLLPALAGHSLAGFRSESRHQVTEARRAGAGPRPSIPQLPARVRGCPILQ